MSFYSRDRLLGSFALALRLCVAVVAGTACGDDAAVPGPDAGTADAPAVTCATGDTVYTPSGTHWDYMHPDEWAMKSPKYAMCNGMTQTPVDITTATTTTETMPLTFNNYSTVPLRLVNNGHTLQVNVTSAFGSSDASITHNGTTYYLVQFHLHTVSEHTINGASFPMELHFVHATDATPTARYLVVGVMYNVGAENPSMQNILTQNPGDLCYRERPASSVALDSLFPTNRSFYHYSPGSLTTPPCSEGLNWFVLSTPALVSAAQVTQLAGIVHGHNNRPIHPLNGRVISRYTAP